MAIAQGGWSYPADPAGRWRPTHCGLTLLTQRHTTTRKTVLPWPWPCNANDPREDLNLAALSKNLRRKPVVTCSAVTRKLIFDGGVGGTFSGLNAEFTPLKLHWARWTR
jgi:hypothetical protein